MRMSPIKPKKLKKEIKMTFSTPKRTHTDIAIEERLAGCGRQESEHIIYVGELVERMLNGEFGAVLKALTAGRTSAELASNKDGKVSSERILGRLEMADSLWSDLEQFVLDKDAMLRPLPVAERVIESTLAADDRQTFEQKFQYAP